MSDADDLLDTLAYYAELHRKEQRKYIPCVDPFSIWSCPWDRFTPVEIREIRAT